MATPRRGGHVSPTPSDFIDAYQHTPFESRAPSLTPPRHVDTTVQQQLTSPCRLRAGIESEADMMRDMEWRQHSTQDDSAVMNDSSASASALDHSASAQVDGAEEEEPSVIINSSRASYSPSRSEQQQQQELQDESSSSEQQNDESIVDEAAIVPQIHDPNEVLAEEPADADKTASAPPAAAAEAADAAEAPVEATVPSEPRQFVMHLFDTSAAAATTVQSPRHHLKFIDEDSAQAAAPAAAPAIDIALLLASGDMAAISAAVQRMAAEKAALEHALRIEKNVSTMLETQSRTLKADALAAKRALTSEIQRAAAAADALAAKECEPIILGANGQPLPIVSLPAEPATAVAAPSHDAAMQTETEEPVIASVAPKCTLSLAALQTLQAPLSACSASFSTASSDIRALCASFSSSLASDASSIVQAVLTQSVRKGEAQEWVAKYEQEKKQRMKLHNQLLEMQGNIRVFARVRPAPVKAAGSAEESVSASSIAAAGDDCTRILDEQSLSLGGKVFEFDKVLPPSASQEQVYAHVAPFVQSVVDGFNVAIFAYGQTGSGKTHTMDGKDGADRGVNVRALGELFDLLNSERRRPGLLGSSVKMSALEIYNETPRDLLVDPREYKKHIGGSASESSAKLEIHQHPDGSVYVPGLIAREVSCVEDITSLVSTHVRPNRAVSATSMNEYSSRSHLVIFIHVETSCLGAQEGEVEKTHGRLVLIDLAGSERVKRSEAVGQALKEASHINKSLAALGDVMSALREKKVHCPFRNSKLTFLLSDCLSGSSKVLMFACASSESADVQESVCTYQFASRVRNVQLGVAKAKRSKNNPSTAVLAKLARVEAALQEAQGNAESLRAELASEREALAAERVSAATRIAEIHAQALEKTRALEADFAAKKAAFSIPVLPVVAPSLLPVPSVSAAKVAAAEAEVKQLQLTLRARDREILELKLQRNNPSVAVAAAPIAAAATPMVQRSLPVIHAFVSPTRQGVNLLDTSSAAAAAAAAGPITCNLDDVSAMDAESAVAVDELTVEIPANSSKKRDSLTGHKRKESPQKAAETEATAAAAAAEDEPDENAQQTPVIAPIATLEKAKPAAATAANKRARVVAPTTTSAARSALGQSIAALNSIPAVATSTAATKPAPRTLTARTTTSLFSAPLVKTPLRTGAVSRMTRQRQAAVPMTPVAAAAAAANAAMLDESKEDPTLTPVPSCSGGKAVRFGASTTKFISPEPSPLQPAAPAAAAIVTSSAPAITTLGSMAGKVRSKPVLGGGALLGGAKRQAIKPTAAAGGWNKY